MSIEAPQLQSLVSIQHRYARSVHLERDLRREVGHEYHLTESVRHLLKTVMQSLDHPADRAMTVVGPYGAGKSAFCVFLATFLDSRRQGASGRPRFPDAWHSLIPRSGLPRLVPVPVVGARQPLGPALLHGLLSALDGKAYAGLRTQIAERVKRLLGQPRINPRQVADLYAYAATEASGLGHGGVLLIVDEMGKFLEHAATHPDDGDIFILQELAEMAARSGQTPLLFLGVLHQNAEAYAHKLGKAQQNEWAKIGERFRAVSFFPSDVERMDLVGRALRHRPGLVLNQELATICREYQALNLLSGSLRERLPVMAQAAYPLHPLTLLALPALFRRSGQSHRSLFNFLAAGEPHTLTTFIQEQTYTRESPPVYTLDRLFDYAAEVLLGSWNSSGITRLWAEAVESVESATDLTPVALRVLKCLALLTLLKEPRLPASPALLSLALAGGSLQRTQLPAALDELMSRRLIAYSRTRDTYRLWEGGDVDVEAELSLARRSLPTGVALHVAASLCPPPRLVARRHTYETGTFRAFAVHPCSVERLPQVIAEASGQLTVVFCLAGSRDDADSAQLIAGSCREGNILIAVAQETDALKEAAQVVAATHEVEQHTLALQHDRAARRELTARRDEATQAFRTEWNRLFGTGDVPSRWWRQGEPRHFCSERAFSANLSQMADHTYWAAPRMRNELINRRVISSAAAAGRRNLIEAMLTRSSEPRLGITSFPPELSMYECILAASGIHRETRQGVWEFSDPNDSDPTGLRPAWGAIASAFFDGPPEPRSLTSLYSRLTNPPYGVTEGVLPILLCAFLLAHRDETSLYREGTFLPDPGVADFEVLLRRPELFGVAGCKVDGNREKVVARLARGLGTSPTTLPIVRALLKMVKQFPEHSWKTRRLPPTVLHLREVCNRARSPEQLLFSDIPTALGVPLTVEAEMTSDQVEAFFTALNQATLAWGRITQDVIERSRDTLLAACSLPTGPEGWNQLRKQAEAMDGISIEPSLMPFIKRITAPREPQASVETVLALISGRPPCSWTDADVDRFPAQANALGALLRNATFTGRPSPRKLSPAEQDTASQLATLILTSIPPGIPQHIVQATLQALVTGLSVPLNNDGTLP